MCWDLWSREQLKVCVLTLRKDEGLKWGLKQILQIFAIIAFLALPIPSNVLMKTAQKWYLRNINFGSVTVLAVWQFGKVNYWKCILTLGKLTCLHSTNSANNMSVTPSEPETTWHRVLWQSWRPQWFDLQRRDLVREVLAGRKRSSVQSWVSLRVQ